MVANPCSKCQDKPLFRLQPSNGTTQLCRAPVQLSSLTVTFMVACQQLR